METIASVPLIILLVAVVSVPLGYFLCYFITARRRRNQEKEAKRFLEEATQKAQRLEKEADLAIKDEVFKRREAL